MTYLAGLQIAANLAVLALAALGGWDLARRGGFRPAEIGMALAALGQMASGADAAGWVWLLRTGAALVVIYTLWKTGGLVVSVRETCAGREEEKVAVKPALVRAVASWPGRRR
jgi:hypothetical protein